MFQVYPVRRMIGGFFPLEISNGFFLLHYLLFSDYYLFFKLLSLTLFSKNIFSKLFLFGKKK